MHIATLFPKMNVLNPFCSLSNGDRPDSILSSAMCSSGQPIDVALFPEWYEHVVVTRQQYDSIKNDKCCFDFISILNGGMLDYYSELSRISEIILVVGIGFSDTKNRVGVSSKKKDTFQIAVVFFPSGGYALHCFSGGRKTVRCNINPVTHNGANYYIALCEEIHSGLRPGTRGYYFFLSYTSVFDNCRHSWCQKLIQHSAMLPVTGTAHNNGQRPNYTFVNRTEQQSAVVSPNFSLFSL